MILRERMRMRVESSLGGCRPPGDMGKANTPEASEFAGEGRKGRALRALFLSSRSEIAIHRDWF